MVFVLALGVLVPIPDYAGESELSTITVATNWRDLPLPDAIAELNEQISKHSHIQARVFLAQRVNHVDLSKFKVTLTLENVPASQCTRYITEVCGLFLYSVPNGLIIDEYHQDHRSWRRKYRDWIRHVLLKRWYGSMLHGS